MAKFLLHGENITQSRLRLSLLTETLEKQGIKEIIRLDGLKVNLEEVRQTREARSLFGEQRLVIIANLLSAQASKRQKEIIDYLLRESYDLPLILWEKREIKGTILNRFKSKFKIEIFKIPPSIFRFLDSLSPGKSQQMLTLLHQIKERESEIIFYMLCQRVRQLILAKDLGEEGLESLKSWQQAKLLKQAENFEISQLTTFYHRLLEIDYRQKTSQTPFLLFSALDVLLADL